MPIMIMASMTVVIPNAFMKDIWNNPYQSIWTIALALHFFKVQVL
jgi:hypothetical protein